MKKFLLNTLFLGLVLTATAQTNRTNGNASNLMNNIVVASGGNQAFGASTVFFNPNPNVQGSVHLFKSWENVGVIHTTEGQRFSINNINLNLERNTFESKISEDSLFTFNFNNIKKFTVNNKVFKTYFKGGANRIFQEVYSSPEFDILKGYKVTLVKGSANPMLNRSGDKYVQKEFYYIRQNDVISDLRLKKKVLAKYVGGDQDVAKRIIERVKNLK